MAAPPESRAVRSRERTCAREAERSETSRRRFNFQHGGAERCSASPRRRQHQQAVPAGQGARLLRRRGRLQPLPGLRGRGRRRHLAVGVSLGRPRRRVDASEAALARCWLAGGPLVCPDSMGDVGGPVFGRVGRRSSSRPGPRSARRPLRRPGRSDAGDLHRRRELEVVRRRRRRRLVVNLHLAGRGAARRLALAWRLRRTWRMTVP